MPSIKTIGMFALGVVAVLAVMQLLASYGGIDVLSYLPRPGAATPPATPPTKVTP